MNAASQTYLDQSDIKVQPRAIMFARVRAVGYVRVSTRMQADEGLSLDAQRDRIAAYCTAHWYKEVPTEARSSYQGSPMEPSGLPRSSPPPSPGSAGSSQNLNTRRSKLVS